MEVNAFLNWSPTTTRKLFKLRASQRILKLSLRNFSQLYGSFFIPFVCYESSLVDYLLRRVLSLLVSPKSSFLMSTIVLTIHTEFLPTIFGYVNDAFLIIHNNSFNSDDWHIPEGNFTFSLFFSTILFLGPPVRLKPDARFQASTFINTYNLQQIINTRIIIKFKYLLQFIR